MYCQANSKPLVKEAGMQLFRDVLLRSTLAPIRSTLRNCLLHSIQHERNGNIIDSSLMKNILDMLLTLGDSLVDGIDAHPPTCVHGEIIEAGSVYTVDFETAFLTHTQTYYEHEVETKAHHGSVAEYLKHCEQRLDEENDRVARYLSPTTLTPLIHITEVTLLQSPMSRLIDQGVLPMLQTKKYDDLHRFYKLAKRVSNGLSQLSDALSKFMSSHSPGLLDLLMSSQQAKDPTLVFLEWTHQVFQLHTHLRTLYTTSFQSDPRLEKVMQTTLSETINKQALLASEAVSACLDHGLRKKGGTLMTDVHLETTALVPCIEVFAYLNEKDAFATYFHHAQSQRLVAWKPGMSEDLEQWVLHQLRTLCGSQFTCKFEKKWIDLHTSMDLAQQFHRMHQAQLGSLEVHVNVLTSSLWPSSTLSSLLSSSSSSSASTSLSTLVPLPSPFKEVMVLFESFYASVHTNRILTWQPQWGSGEVRGYFKQIHDLTINTYGIILLLQFNQRDSFTMEWKWKWCLLCLLSGDGS
ncbi:hypothetical protein HMI56_007293 [Coelomomyces lativittatus]|nr:hypothetical protein HMI56_007293 [Coelomomyces lativittatus]